MLKENISIKLEHIQNQNLKYFTDTTGWSLNLSSDVLQ